MAARQCGASGRGGAAVAATVLLALLVASAGSVSAAAPGEMPDLAEGTASSVPDITDMLNELRRAQRQPGYEAPAKRRLFTQHEGHGSHDALFDALGEEPLNHFVEQILRGDPKTPAEHAQDHEEVEKTPLDGEGMRRRLQEAAESYWRATNPEYEGQPGAKYEADVHRHSLHAAAAEGDIDRLVRLLEGTAGNRGKGAPPMAVDHRGDLHWQAIHAAASAGQLEAVRTLLGHGADVNAACQHGFTPLNYATVEGHEEVVSLLLSQGARQDTQGSAIHQAAMQGHHGVARRLLAAGADAERIALHGDLTPLQAAAMSGHAEVVDVLAAHGVDLDAKGGGDRTPMQHAAVNGHWHIVRRLEGHGARNSLNDPLFAGEADTGPGTRTAEEAAAAAEAEGEGDADEAPLLHESDLELM